MPGFALHGIQPRRPAARQARELELTWPTVNGALQRLAQLGIVREVTGRSRDRIYVYQRQLDLLNG